MKVCKTCNVSKELSEFSKHRSCKDGLRHECKICHRASAKRWRDANLDRSRASAREWQHNNPGRAKGHQLRRHYGITTEEYSKMFETQGGCCAICQINQSDLPYALSVDHSHESGKIRGLLCSKCNTALGMVSDNVETLLSAINYLRSRQ